MSTPSVSVWPKQRPELTPRQQEVLEDWYGYWLPMSANQYGAIARFNHTYPLRTAKQNDRTLEIGAGNGEHLLYENLESQEYYALELRDELAGHLRQRFPGVKLIIGDCQERIGVSDRFFDRVIAIHVLEHLPNLPRALKEIRRVLSPEGRFSAVIPCEGGLTYQAGRQMTSKRIFEKRYGMDYEWMISYEHINSAAEIMRELREHFIPEDRLYFPLRIPSIHANLVIGLTLRPR